MRFTHFIPFALIATASAQCDMEIYGYNPLTTEITLVVNGGNCLTEADSIGEFLLGLSFDPPLDPSPFPCVGSGAAALWATLIFPLDFPGFDIGEGDDNILQSGDTITVELDALPFFATGSAQCWLEAVLQGAYFDECVVLVIYQINDSNTIIGTPGLTGEDYPDIDPANNILFFSLGPVCDPPPPVYDPDNQITEPYIPCSDDIIFVPNAFTPNNDGKNDVFRAWTDSDCWLWFEMQIFNRWGQKVWETTTPGEQWLGNMATRVLPYAPYEGLYYVPDGVYFWKLRGQKKGNEWVELNGHVTLLR